MWQNRKQKGQPFKGCIQFANCSINRPLNHGIDIAITKRSETFSGQDPQKNSSFSNPLNLLIKGFEETVEFPKLKSNGYFANTLFTLGNSEFPAL